MMGHLGMRHTLDMGLDVGQSGLIQNSSLADWPSRDGAGLVACSYKGPASAPQRLAVAKGLRQ